MSQSLRARIAALFHGGTNLLDRDVVLSMVAIPEWFRTLLDIPPFERPPFDAKRIGYRSGGYPLGWIGSDRWRIIQPEERARILGAIDAAGNGLLP